MMKLDLDMTFCRGQDYDGAGNMAGKCSGAAVRIQQQFPKANYVHCGSHLLNLCVASACNIQVGQNMMNHVHVISQFFNVHPKRFDLLQKTVKELLPRACHSHLIDVCRTRWIQRIDGLDVFIEIFVTALETIKDNDDKSWNNDSVRDACSLFHATISFQFIFILVAVSRCLEVTRPLTKQLQSSSFDAVASKDKVNLLYTMLRKMRLEISDKHKSWYDEAVVLAEKVGTVPTKPRTVGRQKHRANQPADSPSEYFRCIVSIPFLDHLISQIELRFSERNTSIFNAFYVLPTNVVSNRDWKQMFASFLELYQDDLPEPRYISTELAMWEEYWYLFSGTPPSNIAELLPLVDKVS